MEALRIVGQPVSRKDSRDIDTGNVFYDVDVQIPGILYEIIIRSSIASGRVTRLDLSQARAIAGIKTVIASADDPFFDCFA